ncbi:MAG: hypothetical protein Q9N34_07465 [Aquificota bacterium]|nr:hypothetical protein [Aquificota bacterium]
MIRGDVLRVLDRLEDKPHIIFADPPYSFTRLRQTHTESSQGSEPQRYLCP